jgi:penicillin-insensitive murein endopeptidase
VSVRDGDEMIARPGERVTRRRFRSLIFGVALIALLPIVVLLVGNDLAIALESKAPSRSVGTPARGRLVHGRRLPGSGPNFSAYSRLGTLLGRNTVHERVRDAVREAYRELERTQPGVRFTYGETGWPNGGRLRPHRTHQNGMSVDFMVPVRTSDGRPSRMSTAPWHRFGYDVEFDSLGRSGDLRIDFAAIAAHLSALAGAASHHGLAIDRVIFAPELERAMRRDATNRAALGKLHFMRERPWVRHDEHYHVDFRLTGR